jgi:protein SCO1/2
MKTRDVLAWLLALLAVGAIVGGAFLTLAALRPDPDPVQFDATDVSGVDWGRDLRLIGDDGRPRALADFRGKVVALYFGYTRCPDVCPITMATLAQAVRLLGPDGGRVQALFVTVDPRHDKPEVLARYLRAFDPSFLGLYGDRQAIARTAQEFKVEVGEHHSIPVFLLDGSGRLRLVVRPEASAESIAHDVRGLLARAG